MMILNDYYFLVSLSCFSLSQFSHASSFSLASTLLLFRTPRAVAIFVWAHEYCCEAAGRSPCDLASNGAVMRCAVSGAVGFNLGRPLDDVARDAVVMGRVTHADPRCAASVAFGADNYLFQLMNQRVCGF